MLTPLNAVLTPLNAVLTPLNAVPAPVAWVAPAGSLIVNSSRGGGAKDSRVLR